MATKAEKLADSAVAGVKTAASARRADLPATGANGNEGPSDVAHDIEAAALADAAHRVGCMSIPDFPRPPVADHCAVHGALNKVWGNGNCEDTAPRWNARVVGLLKAR